MTIPRPASTAADDLLIAVVAVDDTGGSFGGGAFGAPSGWTTINNGACPQESGSTLRCGLASWWKIASASEPTSYTFTWDSSEPAAGVILRYSGTDTSSPIGEVGPQSGVHKANSPNRPKSPSITTSVADAAVLRLLGNDRVGPWDVDGSHELRHGACGGIGDPDLACVAAGDQPATSPGPTGILDWQNSTTFTNIFWRGLTIEILPPIPRGNIQVFKETLPDGNSELFSFTTSGLPGPGEFDLFDDESELFSGLAAASGLYSVTESVPAGWSLVSSCTLGFPTNILVVEGVTNECHFTNVLEIGKTRVPRCDVVGRPDNTAGGGGYVYTNQALVFDTFTPVVLRAVHVYPQGSGTVLVRLTDPVGNVMATRGFIVALSYPGERKRLNLELPVPAGRGFRLDAVGTPTTLYRNDTGTSYPYAGEFLTITGNTFGPDYYYYYYDWEVERLGAVGPSNKKFGSGSFVEYSFYMRFDVSEPTVLEAVHVYPGTAGTLKIDLRDSAGVTLDSVTTTLTTASVGAKTVIALGFLVPPGTNYRLGLDTGVTTATLWRNTSGAVYPFSTPTLTITGNNFSGSYYYFFYDWLFRPASLGWDVHLHDLTLDTYLTVRACGEARLGPDLDIVFPADIEVLAGERVRFDDGVAVETDALLTTSTSSSLLP